MNDFTIALGKIMYFYNPRQAKIVLYTRIVVYHLIFTNKNIFIRLYKKVDL